MTTVIGCYGLLRRYTEPRNRVTSRLQQLEQLRQEVFESRGHDGPSGPLDATGPTSDAGAAKRPRLGARLAMESSFMARLNHALRLAQFEVSAKDFVIRWVMVVGLVDIAVILLVGAPFALIITAAAGFVPVMVIRIRIGRRLRQINDRLHDVLHLLANGLRSGQSFAQAIQLVCDDVEGPIREEFMRIHAEMQVGSTLESALERANLRIGSEDFDLVVTAISIQRQVGGNLAEVLDKISDTIRDRIRLKREVKALTAQGRMSAGIFMVLPTGVGVLLYLMNSTYISALFTSPIGWALLAVSFTGQFMGFLIIRRIVNVEL